MIRSTLKRLQVLVCAGALAWVGACGDDAEPAKGHLHDGGDHHDHDAGHHDHDSGHDGHEDDEENLKLCRSDLPAFESGLEAEGASGNIRGRLVSADPTAARKGQNTWVLDFETLDGTPVTDIKVKRAWTWMAVHRHTGTFEPKATALEEPGRWEFDGVSFTMRGPWEARFELASETAGDDVVVFELCVGR
jgi:hypothetical protein